MLFISPDVFINTVAYILFSDEIRKGASIKAAVGSCTAKKRRAPKRKEWETRVKEVSVRKGERDFPSEMRKLALL